MVPLIHVFIMLSIHIDVLDMVLQSLNQTSIFRSWMVCLNPNTKALEERLIAVTNYRVIALKLEDRNGTFVHQVRNTSLLPSLLTTS